MNPFRIGFGSIIAVNGHLFGAAAFGWIAWVIWPQSPEWWGAGFISISFAMGAFVGLIRALRLIGELYAKAVVIRDFEAQGDAPKSSRMATIADLKRAGMLDD